MDNNIKGLALTPRGVLKVRNYCRTQAQITRRRGGIDKIKAFAHIIFRLGEYRAPVDSVFIEFPPKAEHPWVFFDGRESGVFSGERTLVLADGFDFYPTFYD